MKNRIFIILQLCMIAATLLLAQGCKEDYEMVNPPLMTEEDDLDEEVMLEDGLSAYYVTQFGEGNMDGSSWEQAMDVLQEWFDRKRLLPQVEASSDACVEVWREQQRYCQRQHVDRTPLALVDGRPVPECYAWEHLRYVLT